MFTIFQRKQVKMALLQLPEEMIIEIIKFLDFKSTYSLYHTCVYLKNLVTLRNVIRECHLSMNTMATGQTLKLKFFGEIANHLQVLNLKGVPDLNRTLLFPALRKLKSLLVLDVSYTTINLIDLLEIKKICPTVMNVSINFDFGKKCNIKVSSNILNKCQNMFKELESVHFILNVYNLYSELPLYVLQKSKLKVLKYTVTHCNLPVYHNELCDKLLECNELHVCSVNWTYSLNDTVNVYKCAFLLKLDQKKYEFLIISILGIGSRFITVVATDAFKDFFKKHFNIETKCISEVLLKPQIIHQNFVFMAWDINSTVFDEKFYSSLVKKVRKIIPYDFKMNDEKQMPKEYDSFYTEVENNVVDDPPEMHRIKRRRIAPKNIVLDYDSVFQTKEKIKLTLEFDGLYKNPFALSSDCNYLTKITSLSLKDLPTCSANFFDVLFKCCINIETFVALNCKNDVSILKAIQLSHSLKNLYFEGLYLNFKKVFLSLSKCSSLENVFINDGSVFPIDLADPHDLIKTSVNLYNLQINAYLKDTTIKQTKQMANKAKARYGKTYLNFVLDSVWFYDPFLDVFCLNPIKLVE